MLRFSALRRYGVAWLAGSVLLGVLYDLSLVAVVLTSALLQAAALPIFVRLAARGLDRQ